MGGFQVPLWLLLSYRECIVITNRKWKCGVCITCKQRLGNPHCGHRHTAVCVLNSVLASTSYCAEKKNWVSFSVGVCVRAHADVCCVGQPCWRAQTYGFLSVFNSNQTHLHAHGEQASWTQNTSVVSDSKVD